MTINHNTDQNKNGDQTMPDYRVPVEVIEALILETNMPEESKLNLIEKIHAQLQNDQGVLSSSLKAIKTVWNSHLKDKPDWIQSEATEDIVNYQTLSARLGCIVNAGELENVIKNLASEYIERITMTYDGKRRVNYTPRDDSVNFHVVTNEDNRAIVYVAGDNIRTIRIIKTEDSFALFDAMNSAILSSTGNEETEVSRIVRFWQSIQLPMGGIAHAVSFLERLKIFSDSKDSVRQLHFELDHSRFASLKAGERFISIHQCVKTKQMSREQELLLAFIVEFVNSRVNELYSFLAGQN